MRDTLWHLISETGAWLGSSDVLPCRGVLRANKPCLTLRCPRSYWTPAEWQEYHQRYSLPTTTKWKGQRCIYIVYACMYIVYNCTFTFAYDCIYLIYIYILNTHRKRYSLPTTTKWEGQRCIYIVYACMHIVYNCTFTMYMIVHTLNILNTDRRVTIPPNVLSPNIPQNTQMYS